MTNQNQPSLQNQQIYQNQTRYPKLDHEFVINDTMSPDPQNILPANHRDSHKYTHFSIDAIHVWTIYKSDRPILQLYKNQDDMLTRESIFYHPLLKMTVTHMCNKIDCPPPPLSVVYMDMFNRNPSPCTVNKGADLFLESCPDFMWDYDLKVFRHIKHKMCLFGYRI